MQVMFVCTISPVEYIFKTAKILCCAACDYSSRNGELHCNVQNVKSHVIVCLFLPLDIKERET